MMTRAPYRSLRGLAAVTALVWTRSSSGPDDDCLDELREHLDAD